MVRNGGLSSEQTENLETISRSGEHLLSLINDILEMSKIEAGRSTLQEITFDLHRLLINLEEMFHLRASEKELTLLLDRAPNVPQYVRSDPSKIRQVLINLLGNAIKFTKEGGITLRVGCLSLEEDISADLLSIEEKNYPGRVHFLRSKALSKEKAGHILFFEIEDTGPGIASEEISNLFDPFVQTETGRRSQEGTGLGLAICYRFAELLEGEISVHSEIGRGSIFEFDLPVGEPIMSEIKEEAPQQRVIGLASGQPIYRLLVVEDRQANRDLMVKLLNSLTDPSGKPGFEIRTATNGKEAIEVWDLWEPHLIWMDMRMPVMDGYEATRRIKSTIKGQATVIVALTASAFEENRSMILSGGCDDFLRKPFRDEEIFSVLNKHLGVKFIYEDFIKKESSAIESGLSIKILQNAPAEWRKAVKDAAMAADSEQIQVLAAQVQAQYPEIAKTLSRLAYDFRFDLIVETLR